MPRLPELAGRRRRAHLWLSRSQAGRSIIPFRSSPMLSLSRRHFLAGAAGAALATAIRPAFAADVIRLSVGTRQIEVGGRAPTVHGITRADGVHGLVAEAGGDFAVAVENRLAEPTLVHWHGLTPPWRQDGVPGVSQDPLAPGAAQDYGFPLNRAGTHWMHSHLGLQEQALLAAPLIVRDPAERALDEQEVVVMLHDFSFRPAGEILEELRSGGGGHAIAGQAPAGGHAMSGHSMGGQSSGSQPMSGHTMSGHMMSGQTMSGHTMGGQGGGAAMAGMAMGDVNDIEYDAFLANDRTLDDPEVVAVEPGGRVRLRIINGAAATNFTIDLGAAEGELIAVDGNAVAPLRGRRFPVAIAQRLDIRLTVPGGAAVPVLALREGAPQRTGIVLRATGAPVARIAGTGDEAGPVLDLGFESGLSALSPLAPRAPDRRIAVDLTGGMMGYDWGMSADGAPGGRMTVRSGERVEIVLRNPTMMAHPMHLHGHHFQVTAIGGRSIAGAMRDTLLVPPMAEVAIAFDADNPGRWAFHCHHLYHMAAGMMSTLDYEGVA
jgi:FtsP/CotA-like multicopper oxidase with cupredoxin domain